MPALAATELLEAWDRLRRVPAHWDARNSALLQALGMSCPQDTAGSRQALLLDVYAECFGNRIDGVAKCPACAAEVELTVPVAELISAVPAPAPVAPFEVDGATVHWRLPDGRDLAASASAADPDQGALMLLTRCVLDPAPELTDRLRAKLAERVAAADPYADISFELSCPSCATAWESPLDIGEFVLTRLGIAAQRLLREVDELARAYGWTEPAILALTHSRRDAYLDLVRHG